MQTPIQILLVEDDEDDYILARDMLLEGFKEQHCLTWASNYSDALAALESTCPDVILIDYDLGARNGIEFLRQAMTLQCHTAAILLTGRGSRETDLEAMHAGANDYITKSELTPLLLERTIRYAIERKRTMEALADSNQRLAALNDELEQRVQERTRDLADREARLRLLLSQLPALVWTTDADLHLTSMAGRSLPADTLDSPTLTQMTVDDWTTDSTLGSFLRQQHTTALQGQQVVYDITVGGRDLHCFIEPFRGPDDQPGTIGVSIDVTELKQAEAQARANADRLQSLVDFSRQLVEARLDSARILATLVQHVAERLGDGCIVHLRSPQDDCLVPVAFHHRNPQAAELLPPLLDLLRFPDGLQHFGLPVLQGETVQLSDISPQTYQAQLSPELWPLLEYFPSSSLLVVPLKSHGEVIGVLTATRDRPGRPYSPEDQSYLEAIALRATLSIQNADLYATVLDQLGERRRMEAEISEIQNRLIDSLEAERLSLAQELHDGPMQELYGLTYELAALESDCSPVIASSLNEMQAKIQATVSTLRGITRDLRPPTLTPFGLEKSIRSHFEKLEGALANVRVHFDLDQDGLRLSERVRLALFRIYQVAITNILRHAAAENVYIRLELTEEQVVLEIQDDGRGFIPPQRWVEMAREGHLGLVGAFERAEAIGGRFSVDSHPGVGTVVRVEAPLQ